MYLLKYSTKGSIGFANLLHNNLHILNSVDCFAQFFCNPYFKTIISNLRHLLQNIVLGVCDVAMYIELILQTAWYVLCNICSCYCNHSNIIRFFMNVAFERDSLSESFAVFRMWFLCIFVLHNVLFPFQSAVFVVRRYQKEGTDLFWSETETFTPSFINMKRKRQ